MLNLVLAERGLWVVKGLLGLPPLRKDMLLFVTCLRASCLISWGRWTPTGTWRDPVLLSRV
jgi:hypothetical protein